MILIIRMILIQGVGASGAKVLKWSVKTMAPAPKCESEV